VRIWIRNVKVWAVMICLMLNMIWPGFAIAENNAIGSIDEQKTNTYFHEYRYEPLQIRNLLLEMPKGGDLHNHLTGAVFAEDYIKWAAGDKDLIDTDTFTILAPGSTGISNTRPVADALTDDQFYKKIIDALSMRQYQSENQPTDGHDHFFATFGKFALVPNSHLFDILAKVVDHAMSQNINYLELMTSFPNKTAFKWNPNDMQTSYQLLMKDEDFKNNIKTAIDFLNGIEKFQKQISAVSPGMKDEVTVRFLCSVNRTASMDQVFNQTVFAFELCARDPRVVGLTFLAAEDNKNSLDNYEAQMKLLEYMHSKYPQVFIHLHAGELTPKVVNYNQDDLKDHIRQAVEIAHAKRIGHGVDICYEYENKTLLDEMKNNKIPVEVPLTSNDLILGIKGDAHPFPYYYSYGVPVVLATDDEGVLRTDLTNEFQRAFQTYNLNYLDLKTMVRNSLEYSFLPGNSIWETTAPFTLADQCSHDIPGSDHPSPECAEYLSKSERARAQWHLEKELAEFEAKVSRLSGNKMN